MFEDLFDLKESLNNYVSKIYYINLASRTDRDKHINKCFNELNIKAEKFHAIPSSKHIRGCNQSHLQIIENAKNQNYKSICIFEDDCYFDVQFNDYLQKIFTSNICWDMLFLGHCLSRKKNNKTEILCTMNQIYCTHAYCINSTAYNFLIERLKTLSIPIDHIYNRINHNEELKILAVYPSIVEQVPNKSNIGEGLTFNNNEIHHDQSVYYIRRTT